MPPKKGIVRSGNAGNSSKASKQAPAPPSGEEKKYLFPPGSKTPVSLLYERCQKNGWEKPIIEPRQGKEGFTCSVTLNRFNKKTSSVENVRMEPHPPLRMPTKEEAKHWGATYALYRFANNIQLNLVLPPEPRKYWMQLAEEHKKAPDHQAWQYSTDPFAARKEVYERQQKAAEKRRLQEQEPESSGLEEAGFSRKNVQQATKEYEKAPEVMMASSLREMVESTIKKMMPLYPETSTEGETDNMEIDKATLRSQLQALSFSGHLINKTLDFLTSPPPHTTYLKSLQSMTPLDAALAHLLATTNEADLPKRFMSEKTASMEGFVGSIHSANKQQDLPTRWNRERAVKEAGWPEQAVDVYMRTALDGKDWALLNENLGRRLIGLHELEPDEDPTQQESNLEERDTKRKDEIEALQSVYPDASYNEQSHTVAIPLLAGPFTVHFILPQNHPYPSPILNSEKIRAPPVFLTSTEVAPYVRLQMLSRLLRSFYETEDGDSLRQLLECGEGIMFSSIELLGSYWEDVEEKGPADIAEVMVHLLPPPPPIMDTSDAAIRKAVEGRKRQRKLVVDPRSSEQVLGDFLRMQKNAKYADMVAQRKKLPAWDMQSAIVELIDKSRVVIIVGETGCGKTTQLPQFVLDSLITTNRGKEANIIITQPRRVSALGVSARVSSERMEDGSVGYAIRGESKSTPQTKLLFTFVDYFHGAPVLEIPGFTHPIKDFYIEDVIGEISYRPIPTKSSGKQSEELKNLRQHFATMGLESDTIKSLEVIARSDRIDPQLVAAVVGHIVSSTKDTKAAILVFMPGVQEIQQTIDALMSAPEMKGQIEALPLHANLTSERQRQVFLPTTRRKVVVATNVAETSITIPDVVYVIDTGKVKEASYDHSVGLSRLTETWVTLAAARQRRGRAGRTQPGECYKLFNRRQESTMDEFPKPEILRVSLDSLTLQAKMMREEEDVKEFLGKAIDPPDVGAIESSQKSLQDLGAVNDQGKLTALGRHMALLPLDLRLSKMLILGTVFRCIDPVLTIAACVSSKPLFSAPTERRDDMSQARKRFATGNSDLLTDLNAYDRCTTQRSGGNASLRKFCEENFISLSTLRDISSLRQDFFGALASIGFVPIASKSNAPQHNVNSSNVNLLKSIILGGLWPRVSVMAIPKAIFDKVQAGTVQREHETKEYKIYDKALGRVFIHPQSIMFDTLGTQKSPFLAYFSKSLTTKIFLRDITEVPFYGVLLFGGKVTVNHVGGGLTVGSEGSTVIKMKAWPRIGVLVNQLRRLLDAQLAMSFEAASMVDLENNDDVVKTMLSLLANDGLST
ncbi:hypothetical protein FRC03_006323 [Tulasnella sp. 419]|nr:hypothetical protein FRC03_006323 [Tulasnella sp. 419]